MTKFRPRQLSLRSLLLHPNNYRFLDNPDYKNRLETGYHNAAVQDATMRLLERGHRYEIKALRNSILANGYERMERIAAIPYEHADAKYLVLEGNRRVASLNSLLRNGEEQVSSLTP